MKIAIDCRLINEGGVGRYIRNLIYYLVKLDQENRYTLYALANSKFQIPNSKQISNFKIQITKARWHTLNEQIKFCQELNQGNYDLVHFPYFSHPVLYNRPFVITIHDLTILKYATGKATTKNYLIYLLKRLGYKYVLAHGIRQSKQIIVPTKTVKQNILKEFKVPTDKVTVTYEGVGYELEKAKVDNCKLSRHKPRMLDFISAKIDNYLLYVGNFYPHKNVEFLVKAFAKAKKQGLSLFLAGPDNFFTQRIIKLIHDLKINNRVVIKTNLSDGQLKWLYSKAKALILPSLFEGFGLPVIEAAYFNCPLLLADIPVFREIAPKQAYFFNPRQETDLINKLDQILANKELRLENKSNYDYFSKFAFSKMVKQTLAIYKSVLNKE